MSFIRKMFLVSALLGSGLAWAAPAAPVDINNADLQTLETLDRIGPAKADAIIKYRQANGPFKTVDDLAKVKGVGEKIVAANRANLIVGKSTAAGAARTVADKK